MRLRDRQRQSHTGKNKESSASRMLGQHKASINPKINASAAITGATRHCVYGWAKLPHQRAKVMETTRGRLLFITASTLFQRPLMYSFTFLL